MKVVIEIPEMAYEAYKEWHKNNVATAAESLIANGIPYEEKPKYFPPCEDCNKKMEEIRQAYDKMKATERPQGKWITAYSEKKKKVNKCRVCGFISIQGKTNYCSNCGAEMRKGGAEK